MNPNIIFSSKLSDLWKWQPLFIAVTLLLAGYLVFKNISSKESPPLFQLPQQRAASAAVPFYREESVDPHSTYRMAHVASMTELPDGTLVATWYAGSGELAPDVAIYLSKKTPMASTWSEPQAIMTREQASHDLRCYIKGIGNGLVFSAADGVLHLLYVTVSLGKWSGSQLNLTSSHDGGKSWKRSRRLLLSPFFNLSELVKNTPTPLVDGGWVVPIYQEFLGKFPELLWLRPHGDKGELLATKSRIAGGCSFFQPSMTALNATSAVAVCRDYLTTGKIWRTQTADSGRSWSKAEPTNLPNHDAGICSILLSSGDLLMAFNDGNSSARNTLRLAVSHDTGKSWERIATIAEEAQGDFSYPYFFKTADGTLHLLYSSGRRHIEHLLFNEAWVRSKQKLVSTS
jgi:predicted neuraminidase